MCDYSCPILCCIFSFTVWYALIIVCSLMTISVVSGLGRLTREAMAAASVSMMILAWIHDNMSGRRSNEYKSTETHPSSIVSSRHSRTRSKFSSTARLSSWFRKSSCNASVKACSPEDNISSFSVGPAMKYNIRSSECLYTAKCESYRMMSPGSIRI